MNRNRCISTDYEYDHRIKYPVRKTKRFASESSLEPCNCNSRSQNGATFFEKNQRDDSEDENTREFQNSQNYSYYNEEISGDTLSLQSNRTCDRNFSNFNSNPRKNQGNNKQNYSRRKYGSESSLDNGRNNIKQESAPPLLLLDDIDDIKRCFQEVDINKDGWINAEELHLFMRLRQTPINCCNADNLVFHADTDYHYSINRNQIIYLAGKYGVSTKNPVKLTQQEYNYALNSLSTHEVDNYIQFMYSYLNAENRRFFNDYSEEQKEGRAESVEQSEDDDCYCIDNKQREQFNEDYRERVSNKEVSSEHAPQIKSGSSPRLSRQTSEEYVGFEQLKINWERKIEEEFERVRKSQELYRKLPQRRVAPLRFNDTESCGNYQNTEIVKSAQRPRSQFESSASTKINTIKQRPESAGLKSPALVQSISDRLLSSGELVSSPKAKSAQSSPRRYRTELNLQIGPDTSTSARSEILTRERKNALVSGESVESARKRKGMLDQMMENARQREKNSDRVLKPSENFVGSKSTNNVDSRGSNPNNSEPNMNSFYPSEEHQEGFASSRSINAAKTSTNDNLKENVSKKLSRESNTTSRDISKIGAKPETVISKSSNLRNSRSGVSNIPPPPPPPVPPLPDEDYLVKSRGKPIKLKTKDSPNILSAASNNHGKNEKTMGMEQSKPSGGNKDAAKIGKASIIYAGKEKLSTPQKKVSFEDDNTSLKSGLSSRMTM